MAIKVVQNSERYENRMKAMKERELKLSNQATLYLEDSKRASVITIDYTDVWINERKAMVDILLLLTNWKSQNISVLDFYTISDTNRLKIIVDYDKANANEFARRFLSYIPTSEKIEIVDVEEIEMFELDLGTKDYEDRFIKINR